MLVANGRQAPATLAAAPGLSRISPLLDDEMLENSDSEEEDNRQNETSRIDWDDAALRTVYEIGLKDTIKDGLVHHDKPEDLQALVELATRIDNRLIAAESTTTPSTAQATFLGKGKAKKELVRVVLADDNPMTYGGGMMRLETQLVSLDVAGIRDQTTINIMDLGEEDMLIGYDWEYDTNEFRELFEETEATELAEHQEWDHEIYIQEGAKLVLGPMYPIAPEHEPELREYLRKNLSKRFIRESSSLMASLILFVKKANGKWRLIISCTYNPRSVFLEALVLEMYDPRRKTRVETDALDFALGAVLSQQSDDGKWRPVFYHSRKFSGAELNYDVYDKELLGIEVFSDYQNLTSFMTTKKLNRRQVRWAEMLSQFDFKITHRAGSLNEAADALSRRSDLREEGHKEPHNAVLKKMPDGSLKYNQPELARTAKVAEQEAANWQFEPEASGSDELLQDEREYRDMISKDRTYVPPHMRPDLIKELHESPEYGHAATEEMVRRLAKVFAIPRLRAQVQNILGNCLACHQNKPKRHKPYGLLQPLQPPERPWTSVTMDFIAKLPKSLEPGSNRLCDTILVIVDRLTKATKFVPMEETIMAEECAYEVTKALISEHGVPEEFITDRDKLFTSKYWDTFLAKLGVKKKLLTSFYPETDG
ncbi:reverse transcriptase domain protein [Stemphylium lycopersici]|uniref:Reverse transcriptase domain protein n=1 Tax=Stemphylium lycopersici TaxID=183478 RepID=A0A364MRG0_STELY|nr:reverse transcriptase domain protein [Stemphylium lycopersici]